MKSTYHLLGEFWDHAKESENLPGLISNDPLYFDAGSPDHIFDLVKKRRAILLTTLFSVESMDEMDSIHSSLSGSDEVAIVLDYMPLSKGSVHRAFYEKRLRQVVAELARRLPSSKIVLMRSDIWVADAA